MPWVVPLIQLSIIGCTAWKSEAWLAQVKQHTMNYTLKQLQDRVNSMIKEQGEDAECAAWIYTKEDIHMKDENGEVDYDIEVNDPELVERIFDDVGQIDYIYEVIQDCVDEVVEEQLMLYQQEMVWQLPKCHNGVDTASTPSYTNHIPNNTHGLRHWNTLARN